MYLKLVILSFCLLMIPVAAMAGAPVDLIPGSSGATANGQSGYILDSSWHTADPWGDYDASLGSLAALNQALGLHFSGYASKAQLDFERNLLISDNSNDTQWAQFAARALNELNRTMPSEYPDKVQLVPFSLAPSEPATIMPDDPHLVQIRYDREEYLERLLQRLYFKLIQGPVLLTVPYRADAPSVPQEYRNWNNFRFGDNPNSNVWNDTRVVYVDWSLTQTVVLRYEDGKIACYDSGKKYFIDHTAAISAAAAMFAHPRFNEICPDGAVDFLLIRTDQK